MKEVHIGVVLEHSGPFSLEELCEVLGLPREWVIELVEHGVIEPQGREPERWRFSGAAVGRTRRAVRLQQDLDLDMAGLSLALELLDEVRRLRRRVRDLETLLGR